MAAAGHTHRVAAAVAGEEQHGMDTADDDEPGSVSGSAPSSAAGQHAHVDAPAGAVAPTTGIGTGTGPPAIQPNAPAATTTGHGHGNGGVGVISININTPPATAPTLININVSTDTKSSSSTLTTNPDGTSTANVNPRDVYEVLRSLRKTIFGHLCLARHRTNGQLVAVKLSELTRMAQLRTCEDPRAECRLLRMVTGHPHVVSLLGEYQCERYHWCVYEFVDGGDFFGFVEATGKLGDDASRVYFAQLCHGLSYLHSRGLCHLDLKPDNLLFTRGKEIKICDFGMARELRYAKPLPPHLAAKMEDPNQPPKNYFQGQVGTPMYMAPEVFAGFPFEPCGADVYSIGVVLYIMCTGAPPYELPTKSDPRFNYIMSGRILDLLKHFKYDIGMSGGVIDLLSKMLTVPERRLTLAQVMAHPWLTGASSSSTSATTSSTAATSSDQQHR